MGTLTANATASLTAMGAIPATGSISWTVPSFPSGVVSWDSVVISGTWTWGGKGSISRVTINETNTSNGVAFSINLSTSQTSPLSITCVGKWNALGENFTWSNLKITYTYTDPQSFNVSTGTCENGSITLSHSGSVIGGITIIVTAYPAGGYILDTVFVNGIAISGTSFTVAEDSVVTATFVKQYTGLCFKENGVWVQTTKVYKKISGIWVEQIDLENLLDQNVKCIKKN